MYVKFLNEVGAIGPTLFYVIRKIKLNCTCCVKLIKYSQEIIPGKDNFVVT